MMKFLIYYYKLTQIKKVIDDFNSSENFLLKDDKKIKGIILLDFISSKEIEILNISIKPNYQNQGLGKLFLNQVFNTLKNRDYEKVILGTGNSSIGQLAFYQKLGFRINDIKKTTLLITTRIQFLKMVYNVWI